MQLTETSSILAPSLSSTTVTAQQGARSHSKIHLGLGFACPVADQSGCQKEFSREDNASKHAKLHTHPFLCRHKHRRRRFAMAKDAFQHPNDPYHSLGTLSLCTIPWSWSTIAGKRYEGARMRKHHMGPCQGR